MKLVTVIILSFVISTISLSQEIFHEGDTLLFDYKLNNAELLGKASVYIPTNFAEIKKFGKYLYTKSSEGQNINFFFSSKYDEETMFPLDMSNEMISGDSINLIHNMHPALLVLGKMKKDTSENILTYSVNHGKNTMNTIAYSKDNIPLDSIFKLFRSIDLEEGIYYNKLISFENTTPYIHSTCAKNTIHYTRDGTCLTNKGLSSFLIIAGERIPDLEERISDIEKRHSRAWLYSGTWCEKGTSTYKNESNFEVVITKYEISENDKKGTGIHIIKNFNNLLSARIVAKIFENEAEIESDLVKLMESLHIKN